MKKILIVMVVVTITLVAAGFAAAETTIGKCNGCTMVSTIFGGGTFAPSNGVTVNVKAITTEYCAGSQHQSSNDKNGGLQYHTLSSDPAMPATTATPAATGVPTTCAGTGSI